MKDRFRQHWAAAFADCARARVLVAYSGGPDSTALLHLMHLSGIDIVAAHLDHQMRPESAAESDRCAAFCDSLKVPVVTGQAHVPKMAESLGFGIEEAGRRARYAFFDQAAQETSCQVVATGHTMDDLAETVLFNLARGAGAAGASGIPERRGNIVRPLLAFTREETRAYCQAESFWFHDEPGNEDPTRSRNKVRKTVVPALRQVNPQAVAHIARFAQVCRAEDDFLNGIAATALETACIQTNGPLGFITLDCEAQFDTTLLRHSHPVVLARAVRLAFRFLGATLDHDQTDLLTGLVTSGEPGSITAEGGTVLATTGGGVLHVQTAHIESPDRYPLVCPGETASDYFGWQIVAEPTDPAAFKPGPDPLSEVIDADALVGRLHLRSAKSGDSLQPLGMSGTKKLSDLFNEARLTSAARQRLPIICDMAGIVWVPGVRLADRVKVRTGTNRALALRLEPLHQDRTS